jgi:tetratricopeptide (TPR) repeat protein
MTIGSAKTIKTYDEEGLTVPPTNKPMTTDAEQEPETTAVPGGTYAPAEPLTPPPETVVRTLNWAPAPLSPPKLIGRDAEVDELIEHLDDGVLIISSTGGTGIGATALARRLATDAAAAYPAGSIEINLRGSGFAFQDPLSPADVQRRVIRSVDPHAELPENERALRKVYNKVLDERRALIILEDAASAAQLRYLVPRKGAPVIVTTENDLSSSFPRLYPFFLEPLSAEDTRMLLVQIAPQAVSIPRRALTKLVTRLQGIPLALRIIAPLLGRRPLMSPRRLIRSLDRAQRRVVALRGAETPNTAIDVALETAYESLDDDLKPYFVALALFPAPFTVKAAAAIWDISQEEARRILTRLVQLALVDHQMGETHFEVHLLVRLYAQELLLGQPDRTQKLVFRYAGYYLQEAIQVSDQFKEPESSVSEPMISLYSLWEHLPIAWRRINGEDSGWPKPSDTDRWVSDFPLRVMPILQAILSKQELRAWLLRSLDAAERLGNRRTMSVHLGALGRVSTALDEHQTALEYQESRLEIARERKDRVVEAEALMNIGISCGALGDLKRASASWRKSLVLLEIIGDARAETIRNWLAELQRLGA